MTTILFPLSFFIVLFIIFYLSKKSTVNLFVPTIPSIFVWSYLVFAYIGIYPLYFMMNSYRVSLGVDDPTKVLILWACSSGAIIITLLIFYIFANVFNYKLDGNYKTLTISESKVNKFTKILVSTTFGISLLVVFVYLTKIPSIPILEFIKGSTANELAQSRSSATNGFNGDLHWYRLFYSSVLMFISFYSFSQLLRDTKSKFYWILFISSLIVTSFTQLMTVQKAPFLWFVIGLIIVFLITKSIKLNFKLITLLGIIAAVTLYLMYKFFMGMGNRSLADIFDAILSRALTGQIAPAYFYLEMFPNHEEFLLGRSFPNPAGIFPWEPYSITVNVMNFMVPGDVGDQVVGSAPTVYWGEMYANFGFGGIILSAIIVGIILYLVQFIIFNLKPTSTVVAFTTWSILYFKDLATSGLGSFLFDIDFVVIILITVSLLLANKEVRINLNRSKVVQNKKINIEI